jgi:hypothetical protein
VTKVKIKLTTAIYYWFENHPGAELEHYICAELGWKSVEKLREGMSEFEYLRWCIYYGRIAQRRDMADKEARGGN